MKYNLYKIQGVFAKAKDILGDIESGVRLLLPDGKKEGHEWVALNPTRADKNLGSFRINLTTGKWADFATNDAGGDIISLFAYLKGISQYDAAMKLLGIKSSEYIYFPQERNMNKHDTRAEKPQPELNTSTRKYKIVKYKENLINKIWDESLSANGSPVDEYLKYRGITIIPETIRYHPALYHSYTRMRYPAMVAGIFKWNNPEILGLHRTYLKINSNGSCRIKAEISPNKMMLGNISGGAVMLAYPKAGQSLIITEGIETALSIYSSTNIPTWAALSSSGMISLEPPSVDITPEIIIAADNDKAGIFAANKLSAKLVYCGYKVRIVMPPKKGMDFNDLLLASEEDGEV